MKKLRILVTGARDWSDRKILEQTLDGLLDDSMTDVTLVHGGAKGADTMAAEWAAKHGIRTERYNPMWNMYGRAAGPIRNQQMVDLGADVCVAFMLIDSKGTLDCVRRAQKAGIRTIVINR